MYSRLNCSDYNVHGFNHPKPLDFCDRLKIETKQAYIIVVIVHVHLPRLEKLAISHVYKFPRGSSCPRLILRSVTVILLAIYFSCLMLGLYIQICLFYYDDEESRKQEGIINFFAFLVITAANWL